MRYQQKYGMKALYVLGLLFLPFTALAAPGLANFFSPPPTDISLQVMQNIFGTGTDALDAKLMRPLLMVFSSGIVVFMGAIFAWNLTKFVLHTAQEGEMMVGKGKQMGLVVLRSVIGISMVIPAYSGAAYKGLSLSFIFVAWLITQGIGLADRGVNAIVDYLAAGGTIYQVANSMQDTDSRVEMAKPALNILASEVCLYKLRQAAKDAEKRAKEIDSSLVAVDIHASTPRPIPQASDLGFSIDDAKGQVQFGTRNTNEPASNKPQSYFSECGTVSWPLDATNQKKNITIKAAVLQMISELDPLAATIARTYPPVCKEGLCATTENSAVLDVQILSVLADSIATYSNLVAPLRADSVNDETKEAYERLQSIKVRGWLVLGAYYPMMGNLNQGKKGSLSAFWPNQTTTGALGSGKFERPEGSIYDFGNLEDSDKEALKKQFAYIKDQEAKVKGFITYLGNGDGGTLQEQLAREASKLKGLSGGPFQGFTDTLDGYSKIAGSYLGYISYPIGKIPGVDKYDPNTIYREKAEGATLGGLLEHGKLVRSASAVGLATVIGGPMAWASIPPMLVTFVDIVDRFRVTLDQTKNPDPLLALQDFGFYVMTKAVELLGMILGFSFVASLAVAWAPSINLVGSLGSTANILSPIIAMFFAALAAAGFGFGVYIPMIPLIVWISAILGWIGHSFQAIIGAPLVALRMTTAEGEGMLGGATEGVMMLLGVLLTPFLLVVGFSATLILIKQVMILVNYLFSLFAYFSFNPRSNSVAWIIIGVPAILMVYFTLITGVVQAISTKLIGEFPGEVMRHLHTAMVGHKAAEQMMGKMEQASDKGAGHMGDIGGKSTGGGMQSGEQSAGKKNEDGKKEEKGKNEKKT